jgi:hypothetical protein
MNIRSGQLEVWTLYVGFWLEYKLSGCFNSSETSYLRGQNADILIMKWLYFEGLYEYQQKGNFS